MKEHDARAFERVIILCIYTSAEFRIVNGSVWGTYEGVLWLTFALFDSVRPTPP